MTNFIPMLPKRWPTDLLMLVWVLNPVSIHLQMETSCNGQLEYWPRAGAAANIGIMLFRTTAIDLAKVGFHLIILL